MTRTPRPGSRPYALANMAPGSELLFSTEPGRATRLMQQINTDIYRLGLQGQRTQELLLAIQPTTRQVRDIVRVTALGE